MFVKKLEVVNYRNYEKETVEFCNGTNILYGKNAQGKTNILEAVSLFSSGKSYRRVPDRNLINLNSDFAKISVEFCSFGSEKDAEIFINKNKKFIKLCGNNLRKTSEILGVFKTVLFSPEELSLISGAPELRRNFTDMLLSSEKPLYYGYLKKYYKILKQKNNLLKQSNENINKTLSVWNKEMADVAAKIMCYRNNLIKEIIPLANKVFGEMTGKKESFFIKYVPNVTNEQFEEEILREKILFSLNKKMEAEIFMGSSLVGIHRDDYEFYINEKNAKYFSSQGQQRTAIIALKMAQAEMVYEQSGEYPIFLFDDIMSELDSERREYISEKISKRQVIITCTDKYSAEGEKKYFYVEGGHVTEE